MRSRFRTTFFRLAGLLMAGYLAFAAMDSYSFRAAVKEDAPQRGYEVRDIHSYANWPLEYYASALDSLADPQSAEVLMRDADAVRYYLAPVAGSEADTVLVQVFLFRYARRVGGVSLRYSAANTPVVDGVEWIPDDRFHVSRENALTWYSSKRKRRTF